MTGWGYAWRWVLRTALFLAAVIGFPFIVWGVGWLTGCRSVSGSCGAVALVAGIYLKPVIILLFMLFLVRPAWRRLRSLGEPRAIALLLPLLVLGDGMLFMAIGAHWSVFFSTGLMGPLAPPFPAGVALLLMILFSVSRPAGEREAALVLLHRAMLVSVVLLAAVGLAQLYAQNHVLIALLENRGRRMSSTEQQQILQMQVSLRGMVGRVMDWLGPAAAGLVLLRIASELAARLRRPKPG